MNAAYNSSENLGWYFGDLALDPPPHEYVVDFAYFLSEVTL